MHIFWFRRDLRIEDNVGLEQASQKGPITPIFIFDPQVLQIFSALSIKFGSSTSNKHWDSRIPFIYQCLEELRSKIQEKGGDLQVYLGHPIDVFKTLIAKHKIKSITCNEDYEPQAILRDKKIQELCNENGIEFQSFKDQVIFAKDEIMTDSGKNYAVYTPYKNKWRKMQNGFELANSDQIKFNKIESPKWPTITEMGFISKEHFSYPPRKVDLKVIQKYHEDRNTPAIMGTSRLGVHLRFGTIGIRKLSKYCFDKNETFYNELIWREFFMQILWAHPHIAENEFKPVFKNMPYRKDLEAQRDFEAWSRGETGYPIVDAGMNELNTTGFMHNRVRMIVASFLTKHLLIDWRWGEQYFAHKLLDYDLASNVGNWQWVAGCGVDASPYFRIFNPMTQAEKFDKKNEYILKWVPNYMKSNYPNPMVEHTYARNRAMAAYATLKK